MPDAMFRHRGIRSFIRCTSGFGLCNSFCVGFTSRHHPPTPPQQPIFVVIGAVPDGWYVLQVSEAGAATSVELNTDSGLWRGCTSDSTFYKVWSRFCKPWKPRAFILQALKTEGLRFTSLENRGPLFCQPWKPRAFGLQALKNLRCFGKGQPCKPYRCQNCAFIIIKVRLK